MKDIFDMQDNESFKETLVLLTYSLPYKQHNKGGLRLSSGLLYLFIYFYCYSITVVCIFSPSLHPTPAKPTSLPSLHPPSWFCPCVLYSRSCNPLSSLSPPHSPLAIVRLSLTSVVLVIFCLLSSSVDYVPVKDEIIWYLSFTTWLISISIMLSSSIYAVAKGRSSFFLCAA